MGINFSNLQTIRWCFQMMGSHASCMRLRAVHDDQDPSARTVKVIQSDGVVKVYRRPVNASELMLEFPKHLVCHSDSFRIGQKIPALSADDELQPGHKYFLLPIHVFQSVLSFVTLASFASSSFKLIKNVRGIRPFDILKTPDGFLQIRVSDEFVSKLIEEGPEENDPEEDGGDLEVSKPATKHNQKPKGQLVCTTPELQKDYTQLVGSRSQPWKPKLETIRESERTMVMSRFSGAFGIKRRKTVPRSKGAQKLQRSEPMKLVKDHQHNRL